MKFEEERPDHVVNQPILLKSECRILGSRTRWAAFKPIPDDGLDSDTIVIYSIRVSYIPRIMFPNSRQRANFEGLHLQTKLALFPVKPPYPTVIIFLWESEPLYRL